MKRIVVFTGAGVSADSGLATFRDSDGLWADYRIEDVCTPEALAHNRATVIEFYNKRRREMLAAEPNAGHRAIAELERDFEVEVLTQNVDNLHERAGSSRVTHLHGELTRLRSSRDSGLIVPIEGWEQRLDATAPDGSLLRPHIVFFGESVPMPSIIQLSSVGGCSSNALVSGWRLMPWIFASISVTARMCVPGCSPRRRRNVSMYAGSYPRIWSPVKTIRSGCVFLMAVSMRRIVSSHTFGPS